VIEPGAGSDFSAVRLTTRTLGADLTRV